MAFILFLFSVSNLNWFYWILLGFAGFYWVFWDSPGFTGFHWVLLGFTGFHLVLLGFTGFYWLVYCCFRDIKTRWLMTGPLSIKRGPVVARTSTDLGQRCAVDGG